MLTLKSLSIVNIALVVLVSFSFTEATEEKCRSDCNLPINLTHAEWSMYEAGPRHELSVKYLGGVDTYRPIGPTRPPHTRGHPWFPHDQSETMPSKFGSFCEAGCNFFYSEYPSNITCKRRCDRMYRYDAEGGYSDLAEVARYECYDGCDIALLRCQPGYRCDWPSTIGVAAESNWEKFANMTECEPGLWRAEDFKQVSMCNDCPPGRYRDAARGRSLEACEKCPASRYVDTPRASGIQDCLRCPAGRFSKEPGVGTCQCITNWSCNETAYKVNAMFEGCNSATQECGTLEQRQTYPTMRKPAEYYLCKDKEVFKRIAENDGYKTVVDSSLLDSNTLVYCDNYKTGDFNYNIQQLITKVEERSADGKAFDATMPRGFF